jgi:hypothetical protein
MPLLAKLGLKSPAKPTGPDPKKAAYDRRLIEVLVLVTGLEKHAQQGRITIAITAAKDAVAKAKIQADQSEYTKALALLEDSAKLCAKGLKLADDFANYAKKRAEAALLLYAERGLGGAAFETLLDAQQIKITQADLNANATPPNLTKALGLLADVRKVLSDDVKLSFVTQTKPRITAIKAKSSQAFMAEDIKVLESIQAEVESAIGSENWSQAAMSGMKLIRLLPPAEKMADRRVGFEKQQATTAKAFDAIKAHMSIKTQVDALQKALDAAHALGNLDVMQFEDGVSQLALIKTRSEQLAPVASAADDYEKNRKTALAELDALQKSAAAGSIKDALSGVQKGLDAAQVLADAASKDVVANEANLLTAWAGAQTALARSTADLNAAKKLMDGLAPVAKVQADADKAVKGKDISAIRKAIKELKAESAKWSKAPYADAADDAYKRYAVAINEADAQAQDGDVDKAGDALTRASTALVEARAIQTARGQFESDQKAVQKRLELVQKMPVAKSVEPKTAAVSKALSEAGVFNQANDAQQAMSLVRQAQDAVVVAEGTAKSRMAFDLRAKAVEAQTKKISEKVFREDLIKTLDTAPIKADAFEFKTAEEILDGVEIKMEAKAITDLAASKPGDAALIGSAKKIMSKGGGKQLDDVIAALPGTTNIKVFTALAKERFGVDLSSGSATDATEAKSMQQICKVLAKVPQDAAKNPSLKKILHTKPNKNGGAYGSSDNSIEMNGRPAQSNQNFGANLTLPSGGKQLPNNVEPDCEPVDNTPVDYFDFATLHEVGHAVDDANHFMDARMGKAEFGNWTRYGGKVEPIATAVAKWAGYDATPEQKKYVLDLVLGANPAPPAVTDLAKKASEDAARKKVDDWYAYATSGKSWWNQAGSATFTIDGLIYHEAYAKDWVSYDGAARSKGLTGYQFRAPGEWFAELYAGFHSQKLKPSHPANAWLSKIKA